AIDECAAAGGGRVCLPAGTFLSGTLHLKSRVTLALEAGCTLLGSPNLADYPENVPAVRSYTDNYVNRSLIAGEGLQRVAIVGQGTIDGNGGAFRFKDYLTRPYVIRLVGCSDVLVEGVTLRNSPMWMQHYMACDRVTIRGVTAFNHVSYNNDGLDIDGCRDVIISDCRLDSDDDALCLKSTLERPCENVAVTNCVLSSHCNAFKMGTESNGGFRNITFSNSVITSPVGSKTDYGRARGLAGIALEIVDGGRLENVAVSNIVIQGVTSPIFLRLGNRARPFAKGMAKPEVGTFRNVKLSHIVATGVSKTGCAVAGLPGHPIEDVSLADILLSFEGGGTSEEAARAVPENPEKYPDCTMFGDLPAYGFYVRHARGIRLTNVRLATEKPDLRPAIICDDVEGATLEALEAAWSPGAAPMLRFCQVRGAMIRGCKPEAPAATFLRLEGAATARITLMANDFGGVAKPVDAAPDVPKEAISRPTSPQP
ncbi:MAG: glycoside hydrolase family 28 protein, partial [Planctomycetota bacterium]|nr:glycoside hydrolase family 28 protein [Planctomycetota bacterium]